MALILHLETATTVCSVALSDNGTLMGYRESAIRNAHSALITVFIDEILGEAGISPSGLDAVSVSMGPGSYTGLRIGVAVAKGLCYALGIPMIAIPTLEAMASGMSLHPSISGRGILLCPILDARRMEVYCALFDKRCRQIREVRAEIIDSSSFSGHLEKKLIFFAGEGAEKCKPLLMHQENARFLDDFKTSAKFMIPLAEKRFAAGSFEDVAYFEPFYLKEFIAGKPRVKGLHTGDS